MAFRQIRRRLKVRIAEARSKQPSRTSAEAYAGMERMRELAGVESPTACLSPENNVKIALAAVALLLIAFGPSYAGDLPIINVEPGDASSVQIELTPKSDMQLQIYIKFPKMREVQKVLSDNYKKQVAIQINGKTVSEPIIDMEPPFKGASIAVSYPDVDKAVKAAKEIMQVQ